MKFSYPPGVSIFLLSLFLMVPSCNKKSSNSTHNPNGFPVIKVDYAHHRVERSDGSRAVSYQIPASLGFRLDATGYQFGTVSGADLPINLIYVVQGKNEKFAVQWETGKTLYELSTNTLHPTDGSKKFTGFKNGEEIALIIGSYTDSGGLIARWAGTIEVK